MSFLLQKIVDPNYKFYSHYCTVAS